MVDLHASNIKLMERARNMVVSITGVSQAEAEKVLSDTNQKVKPAILMILSALALRFGRHLGRDRWRRKVLWRGRHRDGHPGAGRRHLHPAQHANYWFESITRAPRHGPLRGQGRQRRPRVRRQVVTGQGGASEPNLHSTLGPGWPCLGLRERQPMGGSARQTGLRPGVAALRPVLTALIPPCPTHGWPPSQPARIGSHAWPNARLAPCRGSRPATGRVQPNSARRWPAGQQPAVQGPATPTLASCLTPALTCDPRPAPPRPGTVVFFPVSRGKNVRM